MSGTNAKRRPANSGRRRPAAKNAAAKAAPSGKPAAPREVKPSRGYREKIVQGTMDLPFFIIVLVLLMLGIVMMFSASYAWAIHENNDGLTYVRKQLALAGVGIVGMLIVSRIDYHILKKPFIAYGLFGVSLIMLMLVLIIGAGEGDIQRWIYIGNFQFQPSEIMKAALIILFAYMISANYSRMKSFRYGMMPFLAVLGTVALLMMMQPHLSGTILICLIGFVMIYVGGAKISHLVATGVVGIAGLAAAVIYMSQVKGMDYLTKRITAWIDPFSMTGDEVWQTQQSLIAIGSGGMFGMGLGNSRQKYLYLPESKNDFVFAIVCEELGFIGAAIVILLFALFIFRGFYISAKSPDKFGMMLAVGLTAQIGLQALLNIAVVTNTIPNTGISLPFFSYGGTALTMQLVEMGVILNISRQAALDST